MEMMQTVRGFINLIKANPTTREQYKSNKLATRKYDNELEIQSSSLEQVQQGLVAADPPSRAQGHQTHFQVKAVENK